MLRGFWQTKKLGKNSGTVPEFFPQDAIYRGLRPRQRVCQPFGPIRVQQTRGKLGATGEGLEIRLLGLAREAFHVGQAILKHRCEFVHREALACEMAHEQHGDALGLRLERLMVRRLPGDERFALVLERKRQETCPRTADDADSNDMGIFGIGALRTNLRDGTFKSSP